MKKMIFLLLISFLGIELDIYSQYENIYNKWLLSRQVNCHDTSKSYTLIPAWGVEFIRNNQAEFFLPTTDKKSIQNFKLEKNHLIFDYKEFIIDKITHDSLIIIELSDSNCLKNIMIPMNKMLIKQKQKHILINSDTIYFPGYGNSPELKNVSNYVDYFINEFTKEVLLTNKECTIEYKFIISKNGDIVDPKGWDSCKGYYEKLLLKIINRTKNRWSPMFIFNEPVNSIVLIKFKHK